MEPVGPNTPFGFKPLLNILAKAKYVFKSVPSLYIQYKNAAFTGFAETSYYSDVHVTPDLTEQ